MKTRKYTNCVCTEEVVCHMKPINADTKTRVDYTDVGPGKKENGVCLLAKGKNLLLPRLSAKAQLK